MKVQVLLLSISLLFTINTFATITTVNSAGGAQYTNLQLAMDEATPGDTLLVSGSFTSPSTHYLDKQLFLFGDGFGNNQAHGENKSTSLNYLYLRSVTAGQDPSGSVISGFQMNYFYHNTTNATFSDILFERNEVITNIYFRYNVSNLTFRNNILAGAVFNTNGNSPVSTITFENNFIEGNLDFNDSDASNSIIRNNIFLDDGQATVLVDVKSATVNNNIFWRQSPGITPSSHCDGCSFNNNIVYYVNESVSQTYIDNPVSGIYGNNVGANNILFTDVNDLNTPIFIDYPSPVGANWSDAHDYTLNGASTAGAQAINGGTDGTDIGVSGGAYPMPARILPRIPQVIGVSSLQTSVPVGGTLQIQFSATKGQ